MYNLIIRSVAKDSFGVIID